jgi:phospholipase C
LKSVIFAAMRTWRSMVVALIFAGCGANPTSAGDGGGGGADLAGVKPLQTVFLILMENHNWSDIKGSPSAHYLNTTLLPLGASAEMYFNPPGIHPSEPNYLWLEAGTNFGITNDSAPSANHQATTSHLVTQLKSAGITWRSYQEDISGTTCPLTGVKSYAPKHNPFVFFDDSTGGNNPSDPDCIQHNRPMTELAGDLGANRVARYNFLTPNLCNDMHDSCAPVSDSIMQGDNWLAQNVPLILASAAYQSGGVILITWDESELGDFPIGMIALSPAAKSGYTNSIHYNHGSTLRSLQEIFGVTPLLGDAANQADLADLFARFP